MITALRMLRHHPLRTAWIGGSLYFVLLGGTARAADSPLFLAVNALVVGAIVCASVVMSRGPTDRIDRLALLALLLFLIPCITAEVPRASLDAAHVALASFAFFFVGRRVAAMGGDPWPAVSAFAILGVALSLFFALSWGLLWGVWTSHVGSLPPLGLFFDTAGFGYRNDVPLLLALLAGALWWSRSHLPAALVGLGLAATIGVLYMSGARMVWISVPIGIVAAVAAGHWTSRRRVFSRRNFVLVTVGMLLVATAGLVFAGDRLVYLATLETRAELWAGSIAAWAQEPLLGSGPGSFPLTLQRTGYFAASTFGPEHADNAVVQALAEGGIVGLGAALAALACLGVSLARSQSKSLLSYVAAVFLLNCLTANPTENGFHVVFALAIAAVNVPATPHANLQSAPIGRRFATLTVLSLFLAASALPVVARISYASIPKSDASAEDQLDRLGLSIALDPGNGLYRRERGLAALAAGHHGMALRDLRTSASLVPWDTSTLRSAAFVATVVGLPDDALAYARRASELWPSDPRNQMALASTAALIGDAETAGAALVKAVRIAPWITGSPEWADMFGDDALSQTLVEEATWAAAQEPSVLDEPVWLGFLSGDDALLAFAEHSGFVARAEQRSLLLLARCNATAAAGLADSVSAREVNETMFWAGVLMAEAILGQPTDTVRMQANLGTAYRLGEGQRDDAYLRDQARDRWIYGGAPLMRDDLGHLLPPVDGLARWVADPVAAAAPFPDSAPIACGFR